MRRPGGFSRVQRARSHRLGALPSEDVDQWVCAADRRLPASCRQHDHSRPATIRAVKAAGPRFTRCGPGTAFRPTAAARRCSRGHAVPLCELHTDVAGIEAGIEAATRPPALPRGGRIHCCSDQVHEFLPTGSQARFRFTVLLADLAAYIPKPDGTGWASATARPGTRMLSRCLPSAGGHAEVTLVGSPAGKDYPIM